jgi:hypothetical protein
LFNGENGVYYNFGEHWKEIELGERAEPNGEGDGRGWKAEHS